MDAKYLSADVRLESARVLVSVVASALWTRHRSKFVTIAAFLNHFVFEDLAARGKTSVDWFFGFKLHLVVNDRGELLNIILTAGNTDDRTPVPKLLQQLFGKVFADKGYVSQKLAQQLLTTAGIQLITKLKRNMKQRLMPLSERLLRRSRAIIEMIIDQLKNISLS